MINAKKLVPDLIFGGGVGWVPIVLNVDDVPINQAAVVFAKAKIPYQFQLEQVDAYVGALAATATIASVVIAAGSNLITAAAPATTSAVPSTLAWSAAGTPAGRRGAAGDTISVAMTTNGTGTMENLTLVLWVRPFPMAGEAN